jgi:FMN reductase
MAALALIGSLRRADGIIIATPSYHGSISGFVKNALDYAEDMRDDPNPYFDGRAVGCIVCADGAQSLGPTLMALRSIVHALRAWPTPFAAAINSRPSPFAGGPHSAPVEVVRSLGLVAQQVVEFAQMRRHYNAARQPGGGSGAPVPLAAGERWPRAASSDEIDLTTVYGFINS